MVTGSRREQLADAAVELVAEHGARALTHRSVEARAGLGPGSASNCFASRRDLVAGVLQRLLQREQAVLRASPSGAAIASPSPDLLVDVGADMVTHALGPGRPDTLARRALFAEAAHDVELSAELADATRVWWHLVADLLRGLDVPDADRRARWLLAYVDGVIADQLARPEAVFDARAALAPAVFGVVHLPPPASDGEVMPSPAP